MNVVAGLPPYEVRLRGFSDRLLDQSLTHWDEELAEANRCTDDSRANIAVRRHNAVCDEIERREAATL